MNIRSTTFPHRNIHKETWYSPDGKTANQIDHVLVNNRFRSSITDVRALRGPDIGSDHNLIKVKMKVKLRTRKVEDKTQHAKSKTVNEFQSKEWKEKYTAEISNRFETLEDKEGDAIINIDREWNNIKSIIKESNQKAAKELIDNNIQPRKKWFHKSVRMQ